LTHDRAIERAFLAQDLAVFLACLLLASLAHRWLVVAMPLLRSPVPASYYGPLLVVFVPAWLWIADRAEIHRFRTVSGSGTARLRALLATQSATLLAAALLLTATQVPLNRSLMVLFFFLSSALLALLLALQRLWLEKHYHQVANLLVGDVRPGLAEEIERFRGRRVEPFPADGDRLRTRFRSGPVDEVVVGQGLDEVTFRTVLRACHEAGIPALVPAEPVDLLLPAPRAHVIGERLYLLYDRHEAGHLSRLVKAIMDRVLALVGLVACVPVFALLALAIRATMGGPIFFVQRRGGLNGRPFSMIKLRTMRAGAELERDALMIRNDGDGPAFKLRNDPRVTRLGRFLRASSLDELPQLVNVLLGHMSLVGPRPLPLVETCALTGAERRRLSMRPGLTCLWQVGGRSDLPFKEWMALDLKYIDEWSLPLDMAILLKTIPALVSRRGAR
jgi:lipopolysaccharide/colanic/teichoic acid biosynthesis glycosyltransferase